MGYKSTEYVLFLVGVKRWLLLGTHHHSYMKQFFPLDSRAVCSISINDSHQIFNPFLHFCWYFEAQWGLLIFGEQFCTSSVLFYLVRQTAGNLDKSSAHLFLLKCFRENPSPICKPEQVSDNRFSISLLNSPPQRTLCSSLILILRQMFEVHVNFSFSSVG